LKPSILLEFGPGLKPSQASFDHKLADGSEREPEILDVLTKGVIGRVVFNTSLGPFVSQVIAYDAKFLILGHALMQFGMSLNFEYIDRVPTNVINNLKNRVQRFACTTQPQQRQCLVLWLKESTTYEL